MFFYPGYPWKRAISVVERVAARGKRGRRLFAFMKVEELVDVVQKNFHGYHG